MSGLADDYKNNGKKYFQSLLPDVIKESVFGPEIENVYSLHRQGLSAQKSADRELTTIINIFNNYRSDALEELIHKIEYVIHQSEQVRFDVDKVV